MHRFHRDEAPPFTTKDGSTIRALVDVRLGGAKNQSLAEALLPPGEATERHCHPASEEIYYFLSGRGEMEVSGARERVRPGDAVLIPSGAMHQVRADDDAELLFLCCCAPAYSDADTVKIKGDRP